MKAVRLSTQQVSNYSELNGSVKTPLLKAPHRADSRRPNHGCPLLHYISPLTSLEKQLKPLLYKAPRMSTKECGFQPFAEVRGEP